MAGVGLLGLPSAGLASSPSIDAKLLPDVVRAYKGKTVVTHFWASWCGPCHQVFPILNGLAKDYPAGLRVLGISIDSDKARLERWLADNPSKWIDYHVGADTREIGRQMGELGVKFGGGIPFTAFFNEKGSVIGQLKGAHDASSYARYVPETAKALTPGNWIVGPDGQLIPQ